MNKNILIGRQVVKSLQLCASEGDAGTGLVIAGPDISRGKYVIAVSWKTTPTLVQMIQLDDVVFINPVNDDLMNISVPRLSGSLW